MLKPPKQKVIVLAKVKNHTQSLNIKNHEILYKQTMTVRYTGPDYTKTKNQKWKYALWH